MSVIFFSDLKWEDNLHKISTCITTNKSLSKMKIYVHSEEQIEKKRTRASLNSFKSNQRKVSIVTLMVNTMSNDLIKQRAHKEPYFFILIKSIN